MTREEIAKAEIGRTDITPLKAWIIFGFFVGTLYALPALQVIHDLALYRSGERPSPRPRAADLAPLLRGAAARARPATPSVFGAVVAVNRDLLREMNAWERALDDASLLTQRLLGPAQYVFTRFLGVGNEEAYVGRDGWLFYRPGVDYVTSPGFLEKTVLRKRRQAADEWEDPPHPDPRPAIVEFHRRLAERDIALIVMPTPVKPTLHPDALSARLRPGRDAVQNPSYRRFLEDLAASGVIVFDPVGALAARAGPGHDRLYLKTDTHWTPAAMRAAADGLAAAIRAAVPLPPREPAGYGQRPVTVSNRGDIAVMLRLPPGQNLYPAETAGIMQTLTANEEIWRPDPAADVLLLGDSFSNIYSLPAMGWGESAGFAEQLSAALQRPVDARVINDHGAFATRGAVAAELARGRDVLAGKRLVVWQFAARELLVGDWKPIDLVPGEPGASPFISLEPDREMPVSAAVAAVSAVPLPGTVPYRDHICGVHLVDVRNADGTVSNAQACVFMWSMRDGELTPTAHLRPGDRVEATLREWDPASRLGQINRSEPDDDDLLLADWCWGEPSAPDKARVAKRNVLPAQVLTGFFALACAAALSVALAHESRKATVRLNTGAPGTESGPSAQK